MTNINQEELENILKKMEGKNQAGPSQPSAPHWNVPALERNEQQGETESKVESEVSKFAYDSVMSDSSSSCTDSECSKTENINKRARLRNKRGSRIELKRVSHQIENDWPEVNLRGIKYKNPTNEPSGRTLTKNWDRKIVKNRSLTYGQLKSASRSPSAHRIARTDGWSKTGKQILYQEEYEYNRKVVKELYQVVMSLKSEIESLSKEMEMLKCRKTIRRNERSEEEEDWEGEVTEP